MTEGRLSKEVMKRSPPGRRKRSKPKLTWTERIRGLMGGEGLMEDDWNDRGNWRKKIIWLSYRHRKMWRHCKNY